MHINQFSLVVFKRQHYMFHIFTGCSFVRQFPVLHFQSLQICPSFSCPANSAPPLFCVLVICIQHVWSLFNFLQITTSINCSSTAAVTKCRGSVPILRRGAKSPIGPLCSRYTPKVPNSGYATGLHSVPVLLVCAA